MEPNARWRWRQLTEPFEHREDKHEEDEQQMLLAALEAEEDYAEDWEEVD